ncbi:MAG: alpha/beta fold hydrolase [Acidobacteriota bacterium]
MSNPVPPDELRNERGERLDFSFHPGESGRRDLVVVGHGVTANKDREWAVTLAETLSAGGLATLRLSFSGNGESEGRFEESNITKEVEDLSSVIDALVSSWRLAYVGHSMGGAVGVLHANEDLRIQALVSLAGMVEVAEFAQRKFGELTPGRDCMWDKPECPLSQEYLDDLAGIGTVMGAAAEISVPWLLVHGDADTVVPLSDSQAAAESCDEAELVVMSGVDHVFSGEAAGTMAITVRDWLREHFMTGG